MIERLLQAGVSPGDIERVAIVGQRDEGRQRRLAGASVVIQAEAAVFLAPFCARRRTEVTGL